VYNNDPAFFFTHTDVTLSLITPGTALPSGLAAVNPDVREAPETRPSHSVGTHPIIPNSRENGYNNVKFMLDDSILEIIVESQEVDCMAIASGEGNVTRFVQTPFPGSHMPWDLSCCARRDRTGTRVERFGGIILV
jgi:hypothetical protein